MKPGDWLSAKAARGAGVLQARMLKGGAVAYYFRTTTKAGQRVRIPLGAGIDFKEANKAAALSLRYQKGERDLRAALQAEQYERERQRQEAQARERAAKEKADAQSARTLAALLTAYADQLERDGKSSAAGAPGRRAPRESPVAEAVEYPGGGSQRRCPARRYRPVGRGWEAA